MAGSAVRERDGFDTGRSSLTARLNQLGGAKPVEPTCERQRVERVETKARVIGDR